MAKKKNAASIMADEATAHAFAILRVAAGMRENALATLEALQDELTAKADKFAKLDSASSLAFKELEAQVGEIIAAAYKVVGKGQIRDLERIATTEHDFVNASMNKAIGGVKLFTKEINPKILEAVSGPVILGHASASWWNGQSAALKSKFSGEMAKGILLGETGDQLVRGVRGTKAAGYNDGIMQVSRRDAEALALTSAQAVSNYARLESFKGRRTVKGVEWLSTLDSRTTVICIGLDGKQWRFPDLKPVGHDKAFPGPVAHWRCRSTQIAVTYSWEELAGVELPELDGKKLQAALEEKLKADGKTPEQIAAALSNARASMDGQVSAGLTFETWAADKGDDFVSSIIGPGRYSLWKSGQITFSDLTNQNNRPLTLAQLAASVQSGKPPPETLGVTFAAAPAKKLFVDVQAAAKKAAEEATAAAQAKAEAEAQKKAEEFAMQREADKARLIAAQEAAANAEARLAAAEEDFAKAEELQKKAAAEIAAQKEADELAAKAQAKKLATMGTKFSNGTKFNKPEQELFDSLDDDVQIALLNQWGELKAAKQAKAEAKAAKEALKIALAAAKAAEAAASTREANQAATVAASAERAATNEGIPHPDQLKLKNRLGGSTGAELRTAPDGSLWVVKKGASPDHVREEYAADMLYKALGANVPDAGLFETDAGPIKVSRYLEGSVTLAEAWASPKRRPQIEQGLKEHFAADALLGNWDVIGMNRDNVLVTPDGKVWRIDNGGSLRFRAMGSMKKGTEWDDLPKELFDMRDAKTNPQAAAFFGKLTLQEVARQVEAWPAALTAAVVSSILPMDVKRVILDRANELRLFAARTLDMDFDGWTPEYAERFTRAVFDLKAKGLRDALPSKLKSKSGSPVILEDDQGRPFYGLRKPPVAGATGDAVGDAIKAAVMTINHKAMTGGGVPNPAKVNTALSFKGILDAWEANGTPADKAKAAAYKPWLAKIADYAPGKTTAPANLGFFDHFKAPVGTQTRTQSVVADLWQIFEQKHGPAGKRALEVLRAWQGGQAGNSWSPGARVAKAWMMRRRPGGEWYVEGNRSYKTTRAIIEKDWKDAVALVGNEEILEDVFAYQHAMTQELFDHTALPNVDREARAVRLIRTESDAFIRANGVKPGAYGDAIPFILGAVESHSLIKAVAVEGDYSHATMAAVPFHRAIGAYAFERSPGSGNSAFLGDGENEITADTSGLPKRYFAWKGKEAQEQYDPASKWNLSLAKLRPRK